MPSIVGTSPQLPQAGRHVIRKIALLGNHAPRQCGIATFTTDLSDAIAAEFPRLDCFVMAMNDAGRHHDYPDKVRFELADNDVGAYHRAADFLNLNTVDVLSVQHEYGIFGSRAGANVLTLLRELRMPIVTTLHTILSEPNSTQRAVMDELTQLSERLVVMSAYGAQLLQEVHGVPAHKIDLIPHGIPAVPRDASSKDRLGVEGKNVILTFGLLSPDKGIEYAIDAMPAILEWFPNTVYVVLGATHPHVRAEHGESYRHMLEDRAKRLGVDGNMIFHNRFVSLPELTEFISAADIYITPYLKSEQITSGTLAYALGSGKAVISTPYVYARELLANGRGLLVPQRDPAAIAREVTNLLGDDPARAEMQQKAVDYGQNMRWPAVAQSYVESFERARTEHADRLRTRFQARTLSKRPAALPELNLEHLRLMTDDTGVLQHATFSVPNYSEGYCVDDNARALLLLALVEDSGEIEPKALRSLGSRYLAFLSHAFNPTLGRFRNFMSYGRQWLETVGSEDSHGRALWALGTVVGRSHDPGRASLAGSLFHLGIGHCASFSSPRAWAFTLLGLGEYLRTFEGDTRMQQVRAALSTKLLELFDRTSHTEWPWFEDRVTYSNARLPQALILTGASTRNERMVAVGLQGLEWLAEIQTSEDGVFVPIGSNGFYERGNPKASFDQQPIEASAMISACLEAQRVTSDPKWGERARRAFVWFLGQNQVMVPLYDPRTGGCRDGLHADRANENQGAESTLSFLLALLEMRLAERLIASPSERTLPAEATSLPTVISRMAGQTSDFQGLTR